MSWPGGCKPGSHLCPDNGVVSVSDGRALATASVLQMLLRTVTTLMLVGGLVGMGVALWLGTANPNILYLGLMALLAAATVVLFARSCMPLWQLRTIELTIFAVTAAYLAAQGYSAVLAQLEAGDAGMALSAWHRTILYFALLVVGYALFIPSSWPRTALVVTPTAMLPLVLGVLLWLDHPELAEVTARVATPPRIFDGMFAVGVSAVLAIMGSMVVDRFFSSAFEARESNHYTLVERIGVGGMGEVWLAEHQTLARPAAIKLIREEMMSNGNRAEAERMLRRFEREARATAGLRSPHTVEVYDFGVTGDGTFYYAMEYLDGIDLESLVKKHGPVPAERAVPILIQACESLADAHDHGMTHRDIKPANIFLCRMGTSHDWVKLLDFGLVKQELADKEGSWERLTVDGATSGTPAYMAPEMALDKDDVDGRADLYALGCVGYWLLTGKHVFEGDNHVGIIVEHVKTRPMPPSERTELEIPGRLDEILLKCLEKDPDDRFQSATELAEALAAVDLSGEWTPDHARDWWKLHRPETAERAAAA